MTKEELMAIKEFCSKNESTLYGDTYVIPTDKLLKFLQSMVEEEERFKYVWLNIMDGFTMSWDIGHPFQIDEKEMLEICARKPDPNFKLMKYRCMTDEGFEFTNSMKLK